MLKILFIESMKEPGSHWSDFTLMKWLISFLWNGYSYNQMVIVISKKEYQQQIYFWIRNTDMNVQMWAKLFPCSLDNPHPLSQGGISYSSTRHNWFAYLYTIIILFSISHQQLTVL